MNLTHSPVELAIVGGGAAGLFAAAVAADRKLGCLVFERKARVGAKLLMTANGRCNFTKDIPPERMLADLGEPVASFASRAVRECPPRLIAAGFRAFGLRTKRMLDGRVFPASEKAADVVHVFGDRLRDTETPLLVNCPVTGMQPMKNGFIVATSRFTVWARRVLLATGGLSFPKTGSVGDGQNFARELGHRVVPCRAGLTGVETRLPAPFRAGRVCENAVCRALADGVVAYEWRGEVEFMPWGCSGAAVYNCQRWIARRSLDDRRTRFALELEADGARMTIDPVRPRPLKEAIVTMGGVALDEVDPETMESRLVPGLYFAGEVLDVDGPTGGYNLSLAFATARLAVESVVRGMRR